MSLIRNLGTLVLMCSVFSVATADEEQNAPSIKPAAAKKSPVNDESPADPPDLTEPVQTESVETKPTETVTDEKEPVAKEPVAKEKADQQQGKPSEKSASEDELMTKLLDDVPAAQSAEQDALDRTIESMRNVGQRIGKRDTGRETRELQSQIVSDLEELIERAQQNRRRNQSPPPNSPPQSPQDKQDDSQQQDGGQQSEKSKNEQAQEESQGDAQQAQRNKDDAAESTERQDAANQVQAQLLQRQMLVKDIWGHLPPTVRERMLNIYSEQTLPKYDELIRRYYEALAEKNRGSESGNNPRPAVTQPK